MQKTNYCELMLAVKAVATAAAAAAAAAEKLIFSLIFGLTAAALNEILSSKMGNDFSFGEVAFDDDQFALPMRSSKTCVYVCMYVCVCVFVCVCVCVCLCISVCLDCSTKLLRARNTSRRAKRNVNPQCIRFRKCLSLAQRYSCCMGL